MRSLWLTVSVLLLLSAGPALADGFLVPTRPDLPVAGPWAVKDHHVRITVDGPRAKTEVRQTFLNLTNRPLEVTYLFPVPEGAMIESFGLVVEGKEMAGRLLPVEEAYRIYEAIVREKRDPAVLSYAGRGLVKTSVFPIPANGSREVVVRYEELVRRDGEHRKLVYPLDTERFSGRPIEVVTITADITSRTPVKAVYSPTHEIRVERPSGTRAIARWSDERVRPDQDLVLFWTVGEGDVGGSLLTFFPPGADAGHFLFLVSPRAQVDEANAVGKNLVLVLDRSGSMKGEKIEQAKAALAYVLESLSERDRLNVVAFSSAPDALFDAPRPATAEAKAAARAYVRDLTAEGGTDIDSALALALGCLPDDAERQNAVLFLTDGLPTVGVRDTVEIEKRVTAANAGKRDARLFVFGVGYDVNAAFLDRLVEANGGVSENVRPRESVEIAVTSLYRKIRHTVLTDLLIAFDGVEVFDLYPRRLPDLFAGTELVVAGRYRAGGEAKAVVAGRAGGKRRAFRFPLTFESGSDPDERPFVARVWASRKIGFLLDQMRVLGHKEPELVDEIVRLSTEYGIVTEYTAFLADETNDFRDQAANSGRARQELEKKLAEETGGSGANQASNVKGMRHGQQAQEKSSWRDADGELVEVETVQNLGRKTFFRRSGVWVDGDVAEDGKPDEVVRQFSDRYFELVRGQRAAQNRWLSLSGPVLVRIEGRIVKIEPPEEK